MDEIKQTLAILKSRWPEVGLIVGLSFLSRLVMSTVRIYPTNIRTVMQFVSIGLLLFSLIVSLGFLRTVYLEPNERRSLADLVRTGKHFFWRFFILGALAGLATMLFSIWLLRMTGTADTVFFNISGPFMHLLLAKLILLLPAIIIVTDCSIPKSFNLMWKIKLLQAKAKPLLVFFLIVRIALPILLALLIPGFWRAAVSITWITPIYLLYLTFLYFTNLMISVMAIRFVSFLEMTDS
ncbi:MAG: hypothetical protein KAJ18_08025 [Candidatus Omnitrophica bacterium]|nr:hypothetical protein [Candidatus Omnitrophota bacterium]